MTEHGHHLCPARGCEFYVPDHQLACRGHWFQLPKGLRNTIYDEYEPGQTAVTMTDGYRAALTAAEAVWAEKKR